VVANNLERKGKTLWTDSGAGEAITIYAGYDAENEALFIADAIERMLAQNPGDRVAVLYRTNSQSRQIEEALRRYGRKYLVIGGFSYYQRAEVKDAVAYLKLAVTPQDTVSMLRIINTPARGIGKTTVDQIELYAQANDLTLPAAIDRMIEEQQFYAAQPRCGDSECGIEDIQKAGSSNKCASCSEWTLTIIRSARESPPAAAWLA